MLILLHVIGFVSPKGLRNDIVTHCPPLALLLSGSCRSCDMPGPQPSPHPLLLQTPGPIPHSPPPHPFLLQTPGPIPHSPLAPSGPQSCSQAMTFDDVLCWWQHHMDWNNQCLRRHAAPAPPQLQTPPRPAVAGHRRNSMTSAATSVPHPPHQGHVPSAASTSVPPLSNVAGKRYAKVSSPKPHS